MSSLSFSYLNPDSPETLKNFVYSSWIQSFRDSPWAGVFDRDYYYAGLRETIGKLFGRGAKCLFACDPNDKAAVAGYVVFETPGSNANCSPVVLHYCYVKQRFRKKGVAKSLLEKALQGSEEDSVTDYTFRTKCSKWFGEEFNHRPSLARRERLV